jgi:hypothetical protein
MIHLVTYSDNNMTIAGKLCEMSARSHGVEAVWYWRDYGLKATDFYRVNKAILDHPRAGHWLWKPYIILQTMTERCAIGDILIYADAGVEFINNTRYIIDRMTDDVFVFGNMWQHVHWCKADITNAILPGKPMDEYGQQAQASVIFFRVTETSKAFVEEWLKWCLVPGLIDDSESVSPNHPEFRENRHDQAILTTLCYRDNIPLHWWPAMYNAGAFEYEKTGYNDNYPVLFHHHRRRDSEFLMKDSLNLSITNYFKSKYPIAV